MRQACSRGTERPLEGDKRAFSWIVREEMRLDDASSAWGGRGVIEPHYPEGGGEHLFKRPVKEKLRFWLNQCQ